MLTQNAIEFRITSDRILLKLIILFIINITATCTIIIKQNVFTKLVSLLAVFDSPSAYDYQFVELLF